MGVMEAAEVVGVGMAEGDCVICSGFGFGSDGEWVGCGSELVGCSGGGFGCCAGGGV